jgi:hypothetical protein
MDIDRTHFFSEWNEVALRSMKEGGYICYECKLFNQKDTSIQTIEDAIEHILRHKEAGHKMWSSTLKDLQLEKRIKDDAVTTVEVHYAISNGGDGSVSVHFFKTAEEAEEYDKQMDEGWGEPCNRSEYLYFDKDGILINADEDEDED